MSLLRRVPFLVSPLAGLVPGSGWLGVSSDTLPQLTSGRLQGTSLSGGHSLRPGSIEDADMEQAKSREVLDFWPVPTKPYRLGKIT